MILAGSVVWAILMAGMFAYIVLLGSAVHRSGFQAQLLYGSAATLSILALAGFCGWLGGTLYMRRSEGRRGVRLLNSKDNREKVTKLLQDGHGKTQLTKVATELGGLTPQQAKEVLLARGCQHVGEGWYDHPGITRMFQRRH